jgi:hypothetical protein
MPLVHQYVDVVVSTRQDVDISASSVYIQKKDLVRERILSIRTSCNSCPLTVPILKCPKNGPGVLVCCHQVVARDKKTKQKLKPESYGVLNVRNTTATFSW